MSNVETTTMQISDKTSLTPLSRVYKPSKHGFYHCICAAPDMRDNCKATYHLSNPQSEHFISGRPTRRRAEALMLKGKLRYAKREEKLL